MKNKHTQQVNFRNPNADKISSAPTITINSMKNKEFKQENRGGKRANAGRKAKGYTTLYKKVPPTLKAELTAIVNERVREYERVNKFSPL